MNAQLAIHRLEVLMLGIGTVENSNLSSFEVYSANHIGAGVSIQSYPPVQIKITMKLSDAMRVPEYREIAGDMRVTRSMRAVRAYATLPISHDGGRFHAWNRRSNNAWYVEMAVWDPEGPIDEELLRKCRSFVKHVFSHN